MRRIANNNVSTVMPPPMLRRTSWSRSCIVVFLSSSTSFHHNVVPQISNSFSDPLSLRTIEARGDSVDFRGPLTTQIANDVDDGLAPHEIVFVDRVADAGCQPRIPRRLLCR